MDSLGIDIQTSVDFIADLPFYEEEKPFFVHPSASNEVDVEKIQITNVHWDKRGVTVHSMRERTDLSLEKNGFCYVKHESNYLPGMGMTSDTVTQYRRESESLLQSLFKADHVQSYDYKVRKNSPMTLEQFDPRDPLLVEEAAVGAHVDISLDTVPSLLKRLLDQDQQNHFFQSGYRFRLINLWRSILPECEDRPLALCDYTSIDIKDLVPTDRVYPKALQEIYHLKYNKQQQWFWLPNQRADEPFMFITYDSHSGSNARYCPHVSVENPLAPSTAPPRESVEVRILVITKS